MTAIEILESASGFIEFLDGELDEDLATYREPTPDQDRDPNDMW